jgi:hypothetical protein
VCELERRRVVELAHLARDRVGDLRARVAERAAKEARAAVEELFAAVVPEAEALGANEQPRVLLERPVGSEGKPEGIEVRHACARVLDGWPVYRTRLSPWAAQAACRWRRSRSPIFGKGVQMRIAATLLAPD